MVRAMLLLIGLGSGVSQTDWRDTVGYEKGGYRIESTKLVDSLNVRFVGYYGTPGYAWSVYVLNNYAYVADGYNGGLRVIDVSNPTNPQEVGYYVTPDWAEDVYVSGYYACVADGSAGSYAIKWDGRDGNGNKVPSGSYILLMRVGGVMKAEKLIIVR
ncbi:MAG: hypothetical protein DRI52_09830 [Chloroflexi bacterium]|nr:MAG: hypothetical protein DRI52_09830 [Chloroflexota bacterium]